MKNFFKPISGATTLFVFLLLTFAGRSAATSAGSGQAPSAGSGQATSAGSGQATSAGSGQAEPPMDGTRNASPARTSPNIIFIMADTEEHFVDDARKEE